MQRAPRRIVRQLTDVSPRYSLTTGHCHTCKQLVLSSLTPRIARRDRLAAHEYARKCGPAHSDFQPARPVSRASTIRTLGFQATDSREYHRGTVW